MKERGRKEGREKSRKGRKEMKAEQRRESEKEGREGRRKKGGGKEGEREVYLKVKVNQGLSHNLLSCGGGCDGNVDLPDGSLQ